jgi:translation initiation factor IF-2
MTDRKREKREKMEGLITQRAEPMTRLQIVLKTDTMGSQEAVVSAIKALRTPGVEMEVIQAGIGDVSKSDLFLAETGGRLVVGFNVGVLPKMGELAKERQVEVRLYNVIYEVTEGLKRTALSLLPVEEKEEITGRAKVIALFPGGRKSVILGCEVLEGSLGVGRKFRLISTPGTVYTGAVESLHIGKDAVKEAKKGQQAGLKISGFTRAKIGDIVECFETLPPKGPKPWQPKGGIWRFPNGS